MIPPPVMPAIHFDQSAEWIMTVNKNKIGINPSTNKIRTIINRSISGKENVEEGPGSVLFVYIFFFFFVKNGDQNR